GGAGALVRIVEDRRGLSVAARRIERQQPGAETGERVALRPRQGLALVIVFFAERRLEEPYDRHVEPVEPDARAIAFVAVVMERPGRRHDEVAEAHRGALATNRGIGALTLEHEAQRRRRVPMRWRRLSREDELQPGIEGRRGAR